MGAYETEKNAQLVYRLKGLGMAGAVLHIGAHPDDEDIGLLAYLACKYGVRAVYWSASRGEGGQNRIGHYRDEALGIYRTWESMAARSIDGGECLFGPFFDFGYSKNKEETFAKWGRETLVREIVRAIRMVQPHAIVARWKGTPGDIHGQHQAVGQASLEAFEAAGDPDRFPELKAQGLAAWQPLKFYQSMDNSGGDLTVGGAANLTGCITPEYEKKGIVRINTGEFDPVSGMTYQERAWLAYNKHQTQAMGLIPVPGEFYYYFSLYKSIVDVPGKENSLFDGLDPSLTGLADYPGKGSTTFRKSLEKIKSRAREALEKFRADDPIKASDSLLAGLSLIQETLAELAKAEINTEKKQALNYYLECKKRDFEQIAARCLGLELECLSERSRIIPGQRFRVSTRLWNNRQCIIKRAAFKVCLPEKWKTRAVRPKKDQDNQLPRTSDDTSVFFEKDFEVTSPETADLTSPYWLVKPKPKESYLYNWTEGEPSGRPFGPPPVKVNCEVDLESYKLTLQKEVVSREAFPGGFREQTLNIVPPISLHPKKNWELRQARSEEQRLELQIVASNNSDQQVAGSLELEVPPGWLVAPSGKTDLTLPAGGGTETLQHTVTIPADTPAGRYCLQYKIRYGNRDYAVVVTPVVMGTPGLPSSGDESTCINEEFVIKPSQVMVHLLDVKLAQGLRYAYVQGAKEELLDALKSFGIRFHLITDEEMGYLNLSTFSAVVIGPNAYLIREALRKYSSRFLEYVKQGGTLIVQYQGYGYQNQNYTPHPFRYNQPHDRVTHEDAPVKILDPGNVLFRLPNAISTKDFDGWIRERGLFFFSQRDKRYRALLSSSDPGETPKDGGFLECQYGKGNFLYTGYSFFRQLPAGVPGAFRLFANILALPEARILERIDFLKKISLFSTLKEDQLDAVARIMSERWEENGRYICRQGDVGEDLYFIYQGEVEVVQESNGKEKVVFVARKGECLGEMAILAQIPRTASLRARGDVLLLDIKGAHFLALLRQNPDMSIQVIKILVDRLIFSTG